MKTYCPSFFKRPRLFWVGPLLATMMVLLLSACGGSTTVATSPQPAEIPAACASIEQQIVNLKNDLAALTAELNHADFSEKSVLAREIKVDEQQLTKEDEALSACVAAHPLLPLVNATLTGTAVFNTNFGGGQGAAVPVSVGLTFDPNTDTVTFPNMTITVPEGPATVTVNPTVPGSYNAAAGTISGIGTSMSVSIPILGGSTANVSFTTGSTSSPNGAFNPTGVPFQHQTGFIELVGASQAQGGLLGGSDFEILVAGTLNHWPQS